MLGSLTVCECVLYTVAGHIGDFMFLIILNFELRGAIRD